LKRRVSRAASATLAALCVGACQTVGRAAVQPAVLLEEQASTLETIKQTLTGLTQQGRVTLGPGDLTRNSLITVLPPPPGPYEGNSPSMPIYFELVTDGERCYLRERGKDVLHRLPGVSCKVE
jgi:hypothetical protein